MVFFRLTEPPSLQMPPPLEPPAAVLPVTVLWLSDSVAELKMPPP